MEWILDGHSAHLLSAFYQIRLDLLANLINEVRPVLKDSEMKQFCKIACNKRYDQF